MLGEWGITIARANKTIELRRWRLMYEGNRITSMTPDALENIQTEMLTGPMAKGAGDHYS